MPYITRNGRQRWAWVAVSAAALAALATAGVLYATSNPEPAGLTASQPPAPERVSLQAPEAQEQINLPPLPPKEPPQYPNLDSNLNQLAEAAAAAPRTTDSTSSEGGPEPVLVTFYVETERVAELRQYLENNGVYVRNVGEDYIEAHVPPALLGAASEQPGVLRVDTVIPPRPAEPEPEPGDQPGRRLARGRRLAQRRLSRPGGQGRRNRQRL